VVADLALPPVANGGRHGSKIDPASGQEEPLVDKANIITKNIADQMLLLLL
jgi:hypothetical protein